MQTSDTTYCWNAAHLYKTAWIFLSHACSMSSPNTPCKLKSCQWRRIIYCLSCLSRTNWSDTYTKINTQRFVSLQIKKSITSGTVPSRYDVTQAGRMRFVFKMVKRQHFKHATSWRAHFAHTTTGRSDLRSITSAQKPLELQLDNKSRHICYQWCDPRTEHHQVGRVMQQKLLNWFHGMRSSSITESSVDSHRNGTSCLPV